MEKAAEKMSDYKELLSSLLPAFLIFITAIVAYSPLLFVLRLPLHTSNFLFWIKLIGVSVYAVFMSILGFMLIEQVTKKLR